MSEGWEWEQWWGGRQRKETAEIERTERPRGSPIATLPSLTSLSVSISVCCCCLVTVNSIRVEFPMSDCDLRLRHTSTSHIPRRDGNNKRKGINNKSKIGREYREQY